MLTLVVVLVLARIAKHALRLRLRLHDRLAAIFGHAIRTLLRRARLLAIASVFLLLLRRGARPAIVATRFRAGAELRARYRRVLDHDRTTHHWWTMHNCRRTLLC